VPAPPRAEPDGPRDESVLSVGRVAPTKGLEELVKSFALLRRLDRPEARLDVVGSPAGWEGYAAALRALADRAAPGGVTFHGRVTDESRDAYYQRAGALCLLSTHEGFGVPLVEAMRFGTPIVALDAASVAETLGDGGLLLPRADPPLVAEALAEVLGNPAVRS